MRSNKVNAHARRRCLISMAAMLQVINGAVWHRPALAATEQDRARIKLLRLVSQPHAEWVGAAVLPQMDDKTSAALGLSLVSRLSIFSSRELIEFGDIESLQQAFQKSVRADFAEGRCMSVSGWVLARTEVELCALAALSARGAFQ